MEFDASTFKRRIREQLPSGSGNSVVTDRAVESSGAVDLSDLPLVRDDDEFLREAYRRVLKREVDAPGFLHYQGLLRGGVSRRVILHSLVTSREARNRRVKFTGVRGPGWSYAGIRLRLTSLFRGFYGWAQALYKSLFLRPIELLGRKIDYLSHEWETRSDQLSVKLDSYASQILCKADELGGQSEAVLGSVEDTRRLLEQGPSGAEILQGIESSAEDLRRMLGVIVEQEASLLERMEEGTRLQSQQFEAIRTALVQGMERLQQRESDLEELVLQQQQEQAKLATVFSELSDTVNALLRRTASVLSELQREGSARRTPPVIHAGRDVLVTEVDDLILGAPAEEWRLVAYLILRGAPERGSLQLFREQVKPGMVVVDVGAHIGLFTLSAAKRLQGRGKLYAFEPTPRSFTLLKDNVQVNGFLESGVVVLRQAAISDRSGVASLGVYPENSGHNTLFPVGDCPSSVHVQTLTLDEALAGEDHVDVVKIDAEGAEPLVLRGMTEILHRSPNIRILMEFAPVHLRRAACEPSTLIKQIRSLGFTIAAVNEQTGELMSVSEEELLQGWSLNLLLTRS